MKGESLNTIFLLLFIVTSFNCLGFCSNDNKNNNSNDLIVNTTSGLLKGSFLETWSNKKIYSFRGVPFAEPPIKELRFKVNIFIIFFFFIENNKLLLLLFY